MDDPAKPQDTKPMPAPEPAAPLPPAPPADVPAPADKPLPRPNANIASGAQSPAGPPPISSLHTTLPPLPPSTNLGNKMLYAAGGTLTIAVLVGAVFIFSQKTSTIPTTSDTSAKTTYSTPPIIPTATPTLAPDSPEAVDRIDLDNSAQGVDDIKHDVEGL